MKVTILFLAIMIGSALVAVSIMRNIQSNARLKEKRAELARQENVTKDLESRVREASTLEYIEREARKQRLVKPGEVLYVVTPEGAEGEYSYRAKNIQSMKEAWETIRKMMNCDYEHEETEAR